MILQSGKKETGSIILPQNSPTKKLPGKIARKFFIAMLTP